MNFLMGLDFQTQKRISGDFFETIIMGFPIKLL